MNAQSLKEKNLLKHKLKMNKKHGKKHHHEKLEKETDRLKRKTKRGKFGKHYRRR